MPPKPPTASAKRKAPTFKPPRPTAKASKPSTKAAPQPRRKSAPAATTALSSSDDNDDDDDDDDDESSPMQGVEAIDGNEHASQSTGPPPTIPPNLLTKLLHHHFEASGTRIGKDANVLVGKYMETFVREAIARAAFERQQEVEKGGLGGDFLEVEDLEKLAPQLLLDF